MFRDKYVVTYDEIYKAYIDCRKHKRLKESAIKYELDFAAELEQLRQDLCTGAYEISSSVAFCVTYPKLREVFAADFPDRIVHHLLINKLEKYFLNYFIQDTYNCIKGRGTLYGVQRVQLKMKELKERTDIPYERKFVGCFDVEGFFMSIDKEILWKLLRNFLITTYKERDLQWVLWLTEKIVMHRPELLCKKNGNKDLFDYLPDNKTLFKMNGLGLAIGNLTSQIFANFYMTEFDIMMTSFPSITYARYVDDFRLFGDKEEILKLIPVMRKFLETHLHLKLHPRKICLQHFSKGCNFIGSKIYDWGILPGKRIVHNYRVLVDKYNKKSREELLKYGIERVAQHLNCYYGFVAHTCSYNVRIKFWNMIGDTLKEFLYPAKDYNYVKVKRKYTKTHEIQKHLSDIKKCQRESVRDK